jgi:hypothetical protein
MNKTKTCKVCTVDYQPANTMQKVCSMVCAIDFAKQKTIKEKTKQFNKETRQRKQQLKSRNDWIKETQQVFNKYIRLRDKYLPCISCGRAEVEYTRGGQWDCGHYLSRGARPELRFEELNAHKQCKSCNGGSGKYAKKGHTVAASYRASLINKIGLDKVEWLEGPHEMPKLTIDDLKAIKEKYRLKVKQLEGKL